MGEDDDHGRVDPRPGDQLEPLLEGGNWDGRALRLQDLKRVGIEGTREGLQAIPPRFSHRRPEDRAVAQVDAVERSERDGAGVRVRRVGFESPDDPHSGFGRALPDARPP